MDLSKDENPSNGRVNLNDKEKEATVSKKLKIKQFRWTKIMDDLFLRILAEEASVGNKIDKRFKSESYSRVAKAITETFEVECLTGHVINHYRTTKALWSKIHEVRNNSGFGWDEDAKVIKAGPKEYSEYVKAHPTKAQFLNKPIDMYEEMALVCGDDHARGDFTKSFYDTETPVELCDEDENKLVDDVNSIEDIIFDTQIDKQQHSKKPIEKEVRKHGKRRRSSEGMEEQVEGMAMQIGKVAAAITELSGSHITNVLYEEIMKIEGFEDTFLATAFDYLVQHKDIAQAFLAKNDKLRKYWLQKFDPNKMI